eukprot:scaffold288941_cov28-Tisochrysis_lutea.AAC.1
MATAAAALQAMAEVPESASSHREFSVAVGAMKQMEGFTLPDDTGIMGSVLVNGHHPLGRPMQHPMKKGGNGGAPP